MDKIIKFQASWCQPCKQLTKQMDGLEFPVEIVDIDEDVNQEAVNIYNIKGVPTLVFIKEDMEIDRSVGLISREKIEYLINKNYGTKLSN